MPARSRLATPVGLLAATLLTAALALGAGCSMSSAARARQSDLEARQYVAQATELTEEGKLDEAIEQLQLAISQNPTLTTAHLSLGDIYRVQGNYEAAEETYRAAVAIEPRNFEAQYGHGLVLQLLDRLGDAVRAYLRALSIDADDFHANLNLATAYLQMQEAKQALPYAQKAVDLNPQDGPARVNLGVVLGVLGDNNAAIRAYQAAAELMDLTPPLLMNLANSLGQAGRYQEMVNTLGQLLRIAPSAPAYERLGFAHFRLQRYDKALEAFTRAVQLDQQHFPALNGMGVCLLNRYLTSNRADMTSRRQGVAALRKSLKIRHNQPRIVDLVSRYS